MARFNIEGNWYEADNYKSAREQHAKWKQSGSASAVAVEQPQPARLPAVPPIAPVQPKPVVPPSVLAPPARVMPLSGVSQPVPVESGGPALQGIASELKLYRGDTREADVIARDGFQIWGDAVAAISFAGGIAEFILHKLYHAYRNERDIERYIVTAKDRARPTISTSRNEGCGGYDSGNIYRIEYTASELQEYPFDDVIKAYCPSVSGVKFPNFKLYMDRPDLKAAKQIALDLNIDTEEVVYFRHVPGAKITQYKPKGGDAFMPMPAAAAKVRLW